MAPPSTSNAAANGAPLTTSRARPQASRRKANHAADDAAYHGVIPSGALAGSKRAAGDKAEGEPRMKRKRLEPTGAAGNGVSSSTAGTLGRKFNNTNEAEKDGKPSMIDFSTLPIDAIHRYLTQFDIVPDIEPMATTAFDPPPPSTLLRHRGHGSNSASPVPQPLPPTPANRPRRELSASANRRRSSRLLEDDRVPPVAPVLSDVAEVHRTLAHVVERHFRDHAVKEVDTLASFMCAVKAKARMRM